MSQRTGGFSLIELLVVLAIIGIIAAIAYPSYLDQTRRSRRIDATIAIENLAQSQERFHARFRTYTSVVAAPLGCVGTACGLGQASTWSPERFYVLTANGNAAAWTLTATASGTQIDDTACRVFRLTSAGVRSATDESGDDSTDACW